MTQKGLKEAHIQRTRSSPWWWFFGALSLIILGCGSWLDPHAPKKTMPIDYWIWAGIRPDEKMEKSVLYIYQGILRKNEQGISYERKGLFPHPLPNQIYIVFRFSGGLPNAEEIVKLFDVTAGFWKHHHVKVKGLQLDFDSPTSKLLEYSNFLSQVRTHLKSNYKLSITGLGDWVLFGNKTSLRSIEKNTDEIIFQLYQNRQHFTDIERYIHHLMCLDMPFKVGLLNHQTPERYINKLQESPYFKGAVIFVQKNFKEKP